MPGFPTLVAPGGRRRSGRRRAARAVALLAASSLLAGCTGGSDEAGTTPSPPTSPAEKVDLTGLDIPRSSFCDLLDQNAVEDALEGRVRKTAHYDSGDEVEITPGYVDLSHEYNCAFAGRSPAVARAWVFASPVTPSRAEDLARDARSDERCTFPRRGLRFGTPTVTAVCRQKEPQPALRVRMQGLFGDAWLSCELTAPRTDNRSVARQAREVRQRAEQWCYELAATIGARS